MLCARLLCPACALFVFTHTSLCMLTACTCAHSPCSVHIHCILCTAYSDVCTFTLHPCCSVHALAALCLFMLRTHAQLTQNLLLCACSRRHPHSSLCTYSLLCACLHWAHMHTHPTPCTYLPGAHSLRSVRALCRSALTRMFCYSSLSFLFLF